MNKVFYRVFDFIIQVLVPIGLFIKAKHTDDIQLCILAASLYIVSNLKK